MDYCGLWSSSVLWTLEYILSVEFCFSTHYPTSFCFHSLPPFSTTSNDYCTTDWLFFFKFSHMTENMWYLFFCVWYISLNMLSFISIHFVLNDRISLFFMNEQYSIVYLNIFVIPPTVDRHAGWFHTVTAVNSTALSFITLIAFLSYADSEVG